jgi:hypothetical protein
VNPLHSKIPPNKEHVRLLISIKKGLSTMPSIGSKMISILRNDLGIGNLPYVLYQHFDSTLKGKICHFQKPKKLHKVLAFLDRVRVRDLRLSAAILAFCG